MKLQVVISSWTSGLELLEILTLFRRTPKDDGRQEPGLLWKEELEPPRRKVRILEKLLHRVSTAGC